LGGKIFYLKKIKPIQASFQLKLENKHFDCLQRGGDYGAARLLNVWNRRSLMQKLSISVFPQNVIIIYLEIGCMW